MPFVTHPEYSVEGLLNHVHIIVDVAVVLIVRVLEGTYDEFIPGVIFFSFKAEPKFRFFSVMSAP